jgi:hypothetical protein
MAMAASSFLGVRILGSVYRLSPPIATAPYSLPSCSYSLGNRVPFPSGSGSESGSESGSAVAINPQIDAFCNTDTDSHTDSEQIVKTQGTRKKPEELTSFSVSLW